MFIVQPYEQMKNDFTTKLREVVLRRHGVDAVEQLPTPRCQQVQFLEIVIGQLNIYVPEGSEPADVVKAKILTGVMFVLRDEILKDYKYTNATNSTLFTVLEEVMNLTDENPMDQLTRRRLMEVAERFLVHAVYIEGKLGKELRAENVFTKVQGFNVQDGYSRLLDFYSRLLQIKFDASTNYLRGSIEKLVSQTKKLEEEKSSFLGHLMFWRSATSEAAAAPAGDAEVQKKGAADPTKAGANTTTTLYVSNASSV